MSVAKNIDAKTGHLSMFFYIQSNINYYDIFWLVYTSMINIELN